MKRILMVAVFGLTISGLGFLWGCGDDESTNSQLAAGDTTDAEFQMVREMYDDAGFGGMTEFMMSWTGSLVEDVLDSADQLPVGARTGADLALQDSTLVAYHSGSKYWYYYGAGSMGDGYLTVEDSVQFRHATGPVQWPDSALLVGITAGIKILMTQEDDSVVVGQRFSMAGELLAQGDVEIDGTQYFAFSILPRKSASQVTCEIAMQGSGVYSNVMLNLAQVFDSGGCPSAGSITHQFALQAECTGDTTFSYDGSWFVRETFDDGTIAFTFEDNTTRWTFTDDCGTDMIGVPKRFEELLGRQQ